ncbi:DNA helicase PIF1, ATP-dependent [Tanacetum coccineum]
MISLDGGRFTVTTIRMIIYIFKNMFNGSWTTWNEEASMRKLYPGLMSKARYESIKMAQLVGVEFDGSDFSVLKPYNPKWIESSYWEDMIDRVWNKKSKLWKPCGGSIVVSLLKRGLIEREDYVLNFWKKSLNPLTWIEILLQVLVATGFGSKRDTSLKEHPNKGVLSDGRGIDVKRLYFNNRFRATDFYNKVNMISSAEHKNKSPISSYRWCHVCICAVMQGIPGKKNAGVVGNLVNLFAIVPTNLTPKDMDAPPINRTLVIVDELKVDDMVKFHCGMIGRVFGSGQSLRVTLWGGIGDSLIEKKTAFVGMCAIALTSMTAKTYNNKLYLSSTSSTVIYDNDDIPSLQELKTVTSLVEPNKEVMVVDCSQPIEETVENLLLWARNRKNDMVTFHCKVMIKDARRNSGWNYPFCSREKCRKSVSRQAGKLLCEICNMTGLPYFTVMLLTSLTYRLKVVVADDTAHTVVVMFNEIATEFLNCSVDSLIETEDEVGFCYLFQPHSYINTNLHIQSVKDDSGLPTAISNLIGTTHVMELKSYTYYEYGTYESFTCWKINSADLVDDGASSSNQLIIVDDPDPSFKRLARQPSVCTPSNPNEEKRKKRRIDEDSDSVYIVPRLWSEKMPKFHQLTFTIKDEEDARRAYSRK